MLGCGRGLGIVAVGALTALIGCAAEPVNPSFDLSLHEAHEHLARMADAPVELDRPVVLLSGWREPGFVTMHLGPELVRSTGDARVVSVTFFEARTFEQCRERVIEAVQAAFPSDDPEWTEPVDVVAVSMGGLVARYAALPMDERIELAGEDAGDDVRRLRIARLFTISTPHRGAAMADWAPWDTLAQEMRPDSPLLQTLDAALERADYTVYPYVRLDDRMVGESNAAPPGQTPWWVATSGMALGHMGAPRDPRLLADIVARLRNEQPFTTDPPVPVPEPGGDAD
jgi:pimeloyl-ACP methyl ester carboxylesterase